MPAPFLPSARARLTLRKGGGPTAPAGYVFLLGKQSDGVTTFQLRGMNADGIYSTLAGKTA